jgi:hypothetical protein
MPKFYHDNGSKNERFTVLYSKALYSILHNRTVERLKERLMTPRNARVQKRSKERSRSRSLLLLINYSK